MIYVVLDTNVVVSAMLKRESVPGNIVEFALSGAVVPVVNPDILDEYKEVLSRDKFHLGNEIVENFVETIKERGVCVLNPEKLDIEMPDLKDVIFYEVVMEKRKSKDDAYLVTGNMRHFPHETFIVTPREMLDIILDKMT